MSFRGWVGFCTMTMACLRRAGPSASDTLVSKMEEGSASAQSFLVTSFSRLSSGVQGVGHSVGSGIHKCARLPVLPETHFQHAEPAAWHRHTVLQQACVERRSTWVHAPCCISCMRPG